MYICIFETRKCRKQKYAKLPKTKTTLETPMQFAVILFLFFFHFANYFSFSASVRRSPRPECIHMYKHTYGKIVFFLFTSLLRSMRRTCTKYTTAWNGNQNNNNNSNNKNKKAFQKFCCSKERKTNSINHQQQRRRAFFCRFTFHLKVQLYWWLACVCVWVRLCKGCCRKKSVSEGAHRKSPPTGFIYANATCKQHSTHHHTTNTCPRAGFWWCDAFRFAKTRCAPLPAPCFGSPHHARKPSSFYAFFVSCCIKQPTATALEQCVVDRQQNILWEAEQQKQQKLRRHMCICKQI